METALATDERDSESGARWARGPRRRGNEFCKAVPRARVPPCEGRRSAGLLQQSGQSMRTEHETVLATGRLNETNLQEELTLRALRLKVRA